ncbi:MAG TPA: DNA polymerase III subunit delta' [Chloroflexota bacterium]|nr:DNA polymerase III subunit delta' [Chloroflexota bacterium]
MWQIIGHERVVAALQRPLEAGRLPHALLFIGPHRIGKTHLALQLAAAFNCEGDDPPCGRCLHCRQIAAGTHPDVTVVAPADGKESIRIEQVRELRDAGALRPFQGKHKVYIITGAEALTDQAADALLKTLEEPQPQLTLILTASDETALPATIVSRCRVMPFQAVSTDVLVAALRERGEEQAADLARLANGSAGWALQAAAQPALVKARQDMVERLAETFSLDLEGRLKLAESLAADRKDRGAVRAALEVLALLARDLLLISQDLPPRLVTGDTQTRLAAQATRLTLTEIHRSLESLRLAMERIDRNVDGRLTLEALFTALP